jgi:hypothetical protein
MNIRKLQKGLKYRGQVAGVRQTYHVFEASDYFFILSFALSKERRGSGYFNVISMAAVDYVEGRFAGRSGITAKDVVSAARRTKHVATSLIALNILYVLVALDQATILRTGQHRRLYFAVRKARRQSHAL